MQRLLGQVGETLLVLFGVSSLVFLLLAVVPGDPVDVMLGERASTADRESLRSALGLDRPVLERWLVFERDLLRGDLGDSIHRRQAVVSVIAARVTPTLQLTLAAFAISVLIAFPLGILAARHHGRWPDHVAGAAALLGLSIPNFWLGPLLVLLFSIGLGWLPVSGSQSPLSLVLPALTLGLSLAALSTRMLRASMLETLGKPWVRTARAKGLAESAVIRRHVLRNALLPVMVLMTLQFGSLLTGSVITEVVFAWPGIGSLLVEAIQQRDYPLVQGIILLIALIYVLMNRLGDLLAAWLDPRIRAEAG